MDYFQSLHPLSCPSCGRGHWSILLLFCFGSFFFNFNKYYLLTGVKDILPKTATHLLQSSLSQSLSQRPLWNYFKLEEDINKALCKVCLKRMSFKKGVTQTSNLIQHLMRLHPAMYQNFLSQREFKANFLFSGAQLHDFKRNLVKKDCFQQ